MAFAKLHTFAEATAVESVGPHTYKGSLRPDWCIGTVPHGGVVAAVLMRAVSLHFDTTLKARNQPDTMSVHLSYLNRTEAGPFEVNIEHVKIGRQTSVVVAKLTQGRLATFAYITRTNFDNEQGLTINTGWELSPAPTPIDHAAAEREQDPKWAIIHHPPFYAFAHAAQKTTRVLERTGPVLRNGGVDEWLSFKPNDATGQKELFDDAAIAYVADLFPAPFDVAMDSRKWTPPGNPETSTEKAKHWAPTVQIAIDIKKRLPPGGEEWLFQRIIIKSFKNGRFDIETVILDRNMELVATSSHISLLLPAERNTSQRATSKSKI